MINGINLAIKPIRREKDRSGIRLQQARRDIT
jgi:hypothetical protein